MIVAIYKVASQLVDILLKISLLLAKDANKLVMKRKCALLIQKIIINKLWKQLKRNAIFASKKLINQWKSTVQGLYVFIVINKDI